MPKSTVVFTCSSMLMAMVFAYSASVQFNDSDWYLWLPLYCCASVVNFLNWAISSNSVVRQTAKVTLWAGLFLLFKVVIEDFRDQIAGLWSLDLSERVVREKTGSGLVVVSMILQLKAFSGPKNFHKRKKKEFPKYVKYGMLILVSFTFGLPFVFFVLGKGEVKFDSIN